jgi:hypothetical protein
MTKSSSKPAKSRPSGERHGKMVPITEEMRHWSALLQAELESWPQVSAKSMFGMLCAYRGKTIFAALPRSRAFGSGSSIIFKFNSMPVQLLAKAKNDNRVGTSTPGKRWFSFELNSDSDLRDALVWLNQAYEAAR